MKFKANAYTYYFILLNCTTLSTYLNIRCSAKKHAVCVEGNSTIITSNFSKPI